MADLLYNRGLDVWSTFTSDTVRALLLKTGYTPNVDHDFVADLTVASYEITVAGYSRQTLGTKTRTIDDTNNRITYDCADPAFGTLTAGETVVAMVVYKFVTNDADSILLGYYDLVDTATAGLAFTVELSSSGLCYLDQA
jgi:hypothetical protein